MFEKHMKSRFTEDLKSSQSNSQELFEDLTRLPSIPEKIPVLLKPHGSTQKFKGESSPKDKPFS